MVYVINCDGKPLMPCLPVIARLLLKQGKAKCIKRTPFTIKLLYQTTSYTQNITLGIDTGSSKVGSAAVKDNGDVVYLSQVEVRNNVSDKMKQRSQYRRSRRARKTRYRKARWLNRRNSIKKDRFSPTMVSKINSHLKEIKFVKSILPITKTILEIATFDPHALKNPEVLKNKWLYQKGINYGFANTKAYVLSRDNYTCQCCKGKTKDSKLEVHHIIFKKNRGSDEQENLIVLCKTCHDSLHEGKISLKGGKIKGQLRHATQMNSIRKQLLKIVDCEETFGFVTKEHRQLMNLPKEHYIDAAVIASQGNNLNFKTSQVLFKKCVSDGDYKQTRGARSEQKLPTNKIRGFRKFDKVRYFGKEYFIKSRKSIGYVTLMDIEGKEAIFNNASKGNKTPKISNLKRINSRKPWIIQAKEIKK
jgi:hypothetical protein